MRIRQQNLINDLKEVELTKQEHKSLRIEDFEFSYVDKVDKKQCKEIKQFIERHEWLGKLPARPTHRGFIARYKKNGAVAGRNCYGNAKRIFLCYWEKKTETRKINKSRRLYLVGSQKLGLMAHNQVNQAYGKKYRI